MTFAGPGPDARFELLVGAVRVLGRAVAKKAVAKTGGKMPFFTILMCLWWSTASNRQVPTSGFEPKLWPSLTVSLSAMTLWNSKPQENLQSLKYLSQLRNLTCRALKGQCQRSVALSPTVLCGKICDFYRLISPFSVSAPYVSPRKAIPHRCICTTHFGCSIADRGWAHFEMMTAKQLIHLSQARFFRFITWKNT